MSRVRPVLGLTVVLAALTLSGCATETPVCDTASPLLDSGRLAAATELYARAAQAGEGSCAEAGLADAGEQYGRAYAAVAAGSAAEVAGDVDAAAAHYETAQGLDVGNGAAVAGLTRLGRETTRVETPVTPPVAAPASGGVPWWVLATLGATALLIAGVGGLLLWRRLTRIEATLGRTRDTMEEDLGEQQEQGTRQARALDALLARVDAVDADRSARVAALDHGVGELHDALLARTTDQLRLLCLMREQTTSAPGDPRPGRGPEVVLHWGQEAGTAEEPGGCDDELTLVVVTSPRADEPRRRVTLHGFRVRDGGLDIARALDDGGVRCALGELAARPGDPAALADAASALGADLERAERRGLDAVEGDGMVVPRAEHDFWAALDRTVLMRWTRPGDGPRRRSDLCAIAASPRAAAAIAPPDLMRALLDGDGDGGHGRVGGGSARTGGAAALRHALDLALVDAASGTVAAELHAPTAGLLRVAPDGRTEVATTSEVFGA